MVHWQIKLIERSRPMNAEWHGLPKRTSVGSGLYTERIEPYEYGSLEDAQRIKESFSHYVKQIYEIKIFKITPKKKRKR